MNHIPSSFDLAYGSPETDRRDARVERIVSSDMAILRQIHDAVHAAYMLARSLPATDVAYVAGWEYGDFLARLKELIPDVGAEAEAELRELVRDRV